MVPRARLELARHKALVSKTSVSAFHHLGNIWWSLSNRLNLVDAVRIELTSLSRLQGYSLRGSPHCPTHPIVNIWLRLYLYHRDLCGIISELAGSPFAACPQYSRCRRILSLDMAAFFIRCRDSPCHIDLLNRSHTVYPAGQ